MIKREFSADDLPGVKPMEVSALVKHAIDGLENDRLEIRPGLSNMMKIISRLAPGFIFKRLGKSVGRMLAQSPQQ